MWKQFIQTQFGTRIWKKRVIKSYDTDYFDPAKQNAHKWCRTQKKRLECIYKNLYQEDMNEKILDKFRGSLKHPVRCRMDLDQDLSFLVFNIDKLKELTVMSGRFRDKILPPHPEVEKEKDFKEKKGEYPRKKPAPKCHNCREKGHKRPECPHPRRNINNITMKQTKSTMLMMFMLNQMRMRILAPDLKSSNLILSW